MTVSLSAFAETRHREATHDRSDSSWRDQRDHAQQGRDTTSQQRDNGRYDRHGSSSTYDNRNRNDNGTYDRRGSSTYNDRNDNRSYDRRGSSTYNNRNDNRNYDRRGSSYGQSYDRGHRYSQQGRVTRVERFGGGYRVWLGGGYPFFIPEARFRRFPIRVGVSIVLGGVWNAGGYYDAYDYDGYGGYGSYGAYNTSGDLRGIVESVDYRRGTVVVRDDISGSFVTAVLRGRDARLGDLRPGDSVDMYGEWSRNGVFNAYDVRY